MQAGLAFWLPEFKDLDYKKWCQAFQEAVMHLQRDIMWLPAFLIPADYPHT